MAEAKDSAICVIMVTERARAVAEAAVAWAEGVRGLVLKDAAQHLERLASVTSNLDEAEVLRAAAREVRSLDN